jgi:cytochrome c553
MAVQVEARASVSAWSKPGTAEQGACAEPMTGTLMRAVSRMALAVLCLGLACRTAAATGDADQAKGIIVEHCAGCHEVPGYSSGQINIDAPSFQSIADAPDVYTEDRLRAFLAQPHWPMVRFRLSPSDIDNILAFLEKLRAH